MRALKKSNKTNKFNSEINITPFVDVVLVLLIIFMITAPMLLNEIDVSLPTVDNKNITNRTQELKEISIHITENGEIYIDLTLVQKNLFAQGIKQATNSIKDFIILIKADKSVPYGEIMEIFSELQKMNITNISLITQLKS